MKRALVGLVDSLWQTALALLLAVAAVWWLARRARATLVPKSSQSGCGGGCGCAGKRPVRLPATAKRGEKTR